MNLNNRHIARFISKGDASSKREATNLGVREIEGKFNTPELLVEENSSL